MPFIQQVTCWSSSMNKDIYNRGWNSRDPNLTAIGDGYVEASTSSKCAIKDLDNPGKFIYTAISSEPLKNLTLDIKFLNGQSVGGVIQPIGGKAYDAPKNTIWKFEYTFSAVNTSDKLKLEFKGTDLSNNDLLDMVNMKDIGQNTKDVVYVPKRKQEGNKAVYKTKPTADNYWFSKGTALLPKFAYGKDDYHILEFEKCGNKPAKEEVLLTECPKLEDITFTVKNSNGNSGSITLVIPANTGGYIIRWIDPNGNPLPLFNDKTIITGLSVGEYCYQITCECCTFGDCIEVPSCPSLLKDFTTTLASCPGGNNATITITATNGTAPCTYKWSNGKTTASINNLLAGTYTVTITDAEGCKSEHPFIIAEPVEIKATVTNICSATELGSIVLDVKDNRPPSLSPFFSTIEFSWTKFNGGTWEPFSTEQNLVDLKDGGKFKLYYDDGFCFQWIGDYEVKKSNFQVSYTISPVNGASGECTFTVDSGTPPFQYEFIGGTVNESDKIDKIGVLTAIGNLNAETYDLKVTDANGCVKEFKIKIYDCSDPDLDDPTADITNISTKGAADGIIRLTTIDQDDPNVFFEWKGPNSFTANTRSIKNLSEPGDYCVHIVNKSCGKERDFCWTLEFGCTIDVKDRSANTCQGNNGSIALQPLTGVSPYTYLWNDGNKDDTRKGLANGTYKVTVSDAVGCKFFGEYKIEEAKVVINANFDDSVDCNKTQEVSFIFGGLNFSSLNAIHPYSYELYQGINLLSSGNNIKNSGISIPNLPYGKYKYIVTTDLGCKFEKEFTLVCCPDKKIYNITAAITNTFGSTGAVAINFPAYANSPANIKFLWSNGATTKDISGLVPAYYCVTITGLECGFVKTECFQVIQCKLSSEHTIISPCKGQSNGSIALTVFNDGKPYNVLWSNGQTSTTATGLSAGNYTVTLSDNQGCVETKKIVVGNNANYYNLSSALIVRPCAGQSNGSIALPISNTGKPYNVVWSNGQTTKNITGLSTGNYTVTLSDNEGCIDTKTFILENVAHINLSSTVITYPCAGQSNGQIKIELNG